MYPSPPDTISMESFISGTGGDEAASDRPPWPVKKHKLV